MEQEKKQEMIFKFQVFEQQVRQLQEQMEAVERGINDLGSINFGIRLFDMLHSNSFKIHGCWHDSNINKECVYLF